MWSDKRTWRSSRNVLRKSTPTVSRCAALSSRRQTAAGSSASRTETRNAPREQKKSSKNADVAPGPVADEAPAPAPTLGDVELYVLVRDSLNRIDGVLSDGDGDGVLRSDELCRAFGDLRLVEDDLRLVECELLRRRPSLAARGRA